LTDITRAQAGAFAAQVLESVSQPGLGGKVAAAFFPGDGVTPGTLMEKACAALLQGDAKPDNTILVIDPVMQNLHQMLERVSTGNLNVLLLGETGVGKEVLAERLHQRSPRAAKPFLRLNCAALPEQLLESELFGHERGAFSGATATKPGLFEAAHGGTVFLDEVGELSLATQAKLLRVIEDRQILRVGGIKPKKVDIFFVAATNRDLEAEVARGAFRADLFFRLNGVALTVPPLRDRPTEIEPFAQMFAARAARSKNTRPPMLSSEAMQTLVQYSWPGNIRELRNVVERAVLLCAGDTILAEHVQVKQSSARPLTVPATAAVTTPAAEVTPASEAKPVGHGEDVEQLKSQIKKLQREEIINALNRCNHNQTRAAEFLGISRRTLILRIKEFGLPRPRK
jgi:transcriptional regulator with GAF, ATPase, and Fis domain